MIRCWPRVKTLNKAAPRPRHHGHGRLGHHARRAASIAVSKPAVVWTCIVVGGIGGLGIDAGIATGVLPGWAVGAGMSHFGSSNDAAKRDASAAILSGFADIETAFAGPPDFPFPQPGPLYPQPQTPPAPETPVPPETPTTPVPEPPSLALMLLPAAIAIVLGRKA